MNPGDKVSKTSWILWFWVFLLHNPPLPLRMPSVSVAHANPAVQLRPGSMQTDVSALKGFQGLFSYTFFTCVFSIAARTASVQNKKGYLSSPSSVLCRSTGELTVSVMPSCPVHGAFSTSAVSVPAGRHSTWAVPQPCSSTEDRQAPLAGHSANKASARTNRQSAHSE